MNLEFKNIFMVASTITPLKRKVLFLLLAGFWACSPITTDQNGNWRYAGDIGGSPRAYGVGVSMDTNNDGREDIAYYGLGLNGNSGSLMLRDWYSFDPVGYGTHTKLESFPGAARQGAVAFALGGKVYVGCGYSGDEYYKDFWEYDPAGDTWKQIADLNTSDPGEMGRYGAVAFTLNGKGYVGTGYSKNLFNDGSHVEYYNNDFYCYDPATDQWSRDIASLPGYKRRNAVAFVINDEAYVCTGEGSGGDVSDFYKYMPAENRWIRLGYIRNHDQDSTHDDHYHDIVRHNGVAWAADGFGYIATGSGITADKIWEYNPVTDRWRKKTNHEGSGREGAIGFFVGQWGYVLSGHSGSSYYSDMWLFQPNAEKDRSDNEPY